MDDTQTTPPAAKPLSTFEREEKLLTHIAQWVVTDLQDRYKDHVTNGFLTHLLTTHVQRIVWKENIPAEKHRPPAFDRREDIAYHIGCTIFESILEHGCKAGGCGHHVAQSFAKCIRDFTL